MFQEIKDQNKNVPLYGVVDERTKAIVYQGDAYTARFMLFALLIDIFVRGLNLNNPIIASNWDLMLIVIIGGLISTAFQIKSKVMFNRPINRSFIFIILLMGFSAIIALLIKFFLVK